MSPGYSDSARNTGMFETLANGDHWLISGDLGFFPALSKARETSDVWPVP